MTIVAAAGEELTHFTYLLAVAAHARAVPVPFHASERLGKYLLLAGGRRLAYCADERTKLVRWESGH